MWVPCARQWGTVNEPALLDFFGTAVVSFSTTIAHSRGIFCCHFDTLYPLAGRGFNSLDMRAQRGNFGLENRKAFANNCSNP